MEISSKPQTSMDKPLIAVLHQDLTLFN